MSKQSPQHVAIIMDGNGRWAQAQGLPRTFGHQAGVKVVKNIIQAAMEHSVACLTMFVFSQDNWARPSTEVKFLMQLLTQSIEKERDYFMKQNIRFTVLGDLSNVDEKLRQQLRQLEADTSDHHALTLVFAFNYTGQWDIAQACRRLAIDSVDAKVDPKTIDEAKVSSYLMTAGLPDLDLLIRTSGEKRLSNFLLWQLAYAELVFSEKYWPDFTADDFNEAVMAFSKRQRRFGGLHHVEHV